MDYFERPAGEVFADPLCGLTHGRVADLCGVSVKTVKRWDRTGKFPVYARRLIDSFSSGIPPRADRSWSGWTLMRAHLRSPEGVLWTVADLQRWHFERQLLADLRREVERYRRGVPVLDRAEIDRLQRAQEAAAEAAHALGRLYPQAAAAGARQDHTPPPAPALAVSG